MRRQTNAAMPAEHAMSNMYRVRPALAATSGKVVMPGPFMVFAAKTRMAVEDRGWWKDFMRGGGGDDDIIVIVKVCGYTGIQHSTNSIEQPIAYLDESRTSARPWMIGDVPLCALTRLLLLFARVHGSWFIEVHGSWFMVHGLMGS